MDLIFTFDTDSWPIRDHWDLPLIYRLKTHAKLTGVWRDELHAVIPPYVHPSCLAIKTDTIRELNLRFDDEPRPPLEDTLSHFTKKIEKQYGSEVIFPLKRSNRKEYHPVFNGIYGGVIYHHHLGSRYKEGKIVKPQTYGWKERGESIEENKFILDATTHRIFNDPDQFILELAHGPLAFDFKLFLNFLENNNTRNSYQKLLQLAKQTRGKDIHIAYFISGLILKHFAQDKHFIQFYCALCKDLGYTTEANCYLGNSHE